MMNRIVTTKTAFSRADFIVSLGCVVFLLMNLGLIGKSGRIRAKQMVCRANVKYLTHAWLMFADDHDGQLVGGAVTNNSASWVVRPASGSIQAQKDAIRNGALFPYVKTTGLYCCPTNNGSYSFCTYSIAGGANGEQWIGYTQAAKYSELKKPSTRYIFVEGIDPRGFNIGSWVMDVPSKRWVDPLLIWHNNRTTLGFADGHVETHRWVDKSLIDWCSLAIEDPHSFSFYMTPPPDEREDIEFMARGFPYKSLR